MSVDLFVHNAYAFGYGSIYIYILCESDFRKRVTNKMACEPSEDSDQPGHPAQSDQSLRCPHEECLGPYLPIERLANTLIRLGGCPG